MKNKEMIVRCLQIGIIALGVIATVFSFFVPAINSISREPREEGALLFTIPFVLIPAVISALLIFIKQIKASPKIKLTLDIASLVSVVVALVYCAFFASSIISRDDRAFTATGLIGLITVVLLFASIITYFLIALTKEKNVTHG